MYEVILDGMEAISAADKGVEQAESEARKLELQANTLRRTASEAFVSTFEATSEHLVEQFTTGHLTAAETVQAVAELNDLDPKMVRLYRGKRAAAIISAFDALQPNEPIFNISTDNWISPSGVGLVDEPPSVIDVVARKKSRNPIVNRPFMAPYGHISVPLRTLTHEGEVAHTTIQLEIDALATATIGRAAIQRTINKATFEIETDMGGCHPATTTNSLELKQWRQKIDALQQLGMEPVDTKVLDAALRKAERYNEAERARSALRRKRIVRTSRSHW